MITHYLKVAVRNLLKYKTQTIISILGLAVGFVCFALSAFWIRYEMTYDAFHEDAEQLYWVTQKNERKLPYPIAKHLKEHFPEIEDYAIFSIYQKRLDHNKRPHTVDFITADSTYLDMMNIHVIKGNINFITDGSNEIAITESYAKELFGDENPIGKEVILSNQKKTIGAIISGWGKHSNMPYHIIGNDGFYKEWNGSVCNVLLKMKKGTDIDALLQKMNDEFPEEMKQHTEIGHQQLGLIPLTKVRYTKNSPVKNQQTNITFNHIIYFSIAGILIIICALTNYLSIFINRLRIRQKEFALRRVNGSSQCSLNLLLITEFICMLTISVLFGFMLIEIIFPEFQKYAQIHSTLPTVYLEMAIYALGIACITISIIWGIIHYTQHSSLRQSINSNNTETILHKGSIVLQLIISLSFVFFTTVINKQLQYLKQSDLGMVHHNIGSVGIWMGVDMNVWKEKVASLPMVKKVLPPKYFPLLGIGPMMQADVSQWDGMDTTTPQTLSIDLIYSGEEFFQLYDMELICGKWITDTSTAVEACITETTARRAGWTPQEAIGKKMYIKDFFTMQIIGVVKDCAYYPPSSPAKNTAFINTEKQQHSWFRASVLFEFQEGTWETCRRAIEEMHQKECPEKMLRLYNEEEIYNGYLHSENMLTKLLEAASLVCILISIFGIYSLITLTCEQRRKEIAIRKVNGAKISNILQMFFKEYMLLLTIASLIAFPASYAVMKQWLETYNRQTEISAWVFITIFIGFAFVIIGSIGYRVWKAANENPADVVKSE